MSLDDQRTDAGEDTTSPSLVDSNTRQRPLHIILGITGSVAAVKGPALAATLATTLHAEVRVILTRGGQSFWRPDDADCSAAIDDGAAWEHCQALLEEDVFVLDSEDDWKSWKKLGDPVLHIELRRWADVLLVAPLSAHTLGKFANGLCDDLLSCLVRAWDYRHDSKVMLLAPAMNTCMWEHPLTEQQLRTVAGFGNKVRIIVPQVKSLACGEVGDGALASVEDIVNAVQEAVAEWGSGEEQLDRR